MVLSLSFKQRSLWLFSVPRSYENFQHFGTNSFTLEKMWIFFNWFSFGMILVVLPFCGAATFGQMDWPQIAAQVDGESLSGSTARQCCLLYLAIPSVTFYTLRMTNIWYLAHTMKYFSFEIDAASNKNCCVRLFSPPGSIAKFLIYHCVLAPKSLDWQILSFSCTT